MIFNSIIIDKIIANVFIAGFAILCAKYVGQAYRLTYLAITTLHSGFERYDRIVNGNIRQGYVRMDKGSWLVDDFTQFAILEIFYSVDGTEYMTTRYDFYSRKLSQENIYSYDEYFTTISAENSISELIGKDVEVYVSSINPGDAFVKWERPWKQWYLMTSGLFFILFSSFIWYYLVTNLYRLFTQ